jgi:hypothetical protein
MFIFLFVATKASFDRNGLPRGSTGVGDSESDDFPKRDSRSRHSKIEDRDGEQKRKHGECSCGQQRGVNSESGTATASGGGGPHRGKSPQLEGEAGAGPQHIYRKHEVSLARVSNIHRRFVYMAAIKTCLHG